MGTYRLKAAPHIVAKDPNLREEERKKVFQEINTVFLVLLKSSSSLEMLIQKEAAGVVSVCYRSPEDALGTDTLLEGGRYFQLSKCTAANSFTYDSQSSLSLRRQIRLFPVGNLAKLNWKDEERENNILPLVANVSPEQRLYVVPLPKPIQLSSRYSQWKNILSVLALAGGKLHIQVEKYTPRLSEVGYAQQVLKWYRYTYEDKLLLAELDANTKIYQAIVAGNEVYKVKITISDGDLERIRLALLYDTDPEAFSSGKSLFNSKIQYVNQEDREVALQLSQLFSSEEAIELLTPPYTFEDALPGVRHCVPKPFIMPSTTEHQNLEPSLILGEREKQQPIVLSLEDLRRHLFICGASGAGKTHTIQHLLRQLNSNSPRVKHDE